VGLYHPTQSPQVVVLDVPPVAAQVDCDPACARDVGKDRGRDDARLERAPRLADGRYVVNVYV
jgi:hypothetical protein